MKLVRFGAKGQEKPGVITDDGTVRDLSAVTADFAGASISCDAIEKLKSLDLTALPEVEKGVRQGAPLASIGNFLCVGLNYTNHARESNLPIPAEPILFNKAPSCLSGPCDPVVRAADADKLDWEVELAVVIGRPAYRIDRADALNHVAGYAICNDVSERSWQIEGTGQWVKGKSAPSFGPLGPWLVTADEVPDPQALELKLELNGKVMQSSSTADMIFPVDEIIAYTSRFMRLEPGDVITTGTPEGVGMGWNPQVWLQTGDEMRLTVSGLGEQRQTVTAG
ncbi:MAG: 2-hydroxyhepta-2,4-diene-1,7-dioate isomerase [Rhizobiaceae bacterium MnEN-MB40S]|nr:MAG: 2-hydroxyhepta-2,4-diene-1,7-dioate isomerase [Rhizobiaceae bacterium MnEN-MB40S]